MRKCRDCEKKINDDALYCSEHRKEVAEEFGLSVATIRRYEKMLYKQKHKCFQEDQEDQEDNETPNP